MKPKEILGLVFRLVGLFGIIVVVRHWAIMWHRTGSPHFYEPFPLILEMALILIGIYMLCGCPLIMKFAYRENKSETPEKES